MNRICKGRQVAVALMLMGAGISCRHAAPPDSHAPATPAVESAFPLRESSEEILRKAAAVEPFKPEGEGWKPLFDGETLKGWEETDFSGRGNIAIQDGIIVMEMGSPFTGIHYTNEPPLMNYEIALETMRVDGSDFFCGLTFPVADSHCSLILGGWGGAVVGLSSLDGMDASENETTKYMKFDRGRWHRVRLRVTESKIEAWLDGEQIVNVDTTDRRISVRFGEIELSKPLGIASWSTSGAVRSVYLRRL